MKLVRTILLLSVVVLIGASLSSCQSEPTSVQGEVDTTALSRPITFDLKDIQERGTLRVILDNSSTGYFLYRGQPMGYEHDLLDLFAKEIGVSLEYHLTTDLASTFNLLNEGVGDVIAYSLTITNERKQFISFSHPHIQARQMLIQRKPDNWRQLKLHEIEKTLVRNQVDLIGKDIIVRPASAYVSRLRNLSDEIGGEINIIEEYPGASTEDFIEMVAEGVIKYTIADEHVAMVNATYYPNIDVQTPVSFPQQIGWGVRKNAPELLTAINEWVDKMRNKTEYYVIFNKYFKNTRTQRTIARSDYSSAFSGQKLSPYDDLIKEGANSIGWDWKLLAAQIYQESKFNPDAKSWAGAIGLMQLLPQTGMAYGVTDLTNPARSIEAGTKHLTWLDNYWKKKVTDSLERVKFVLGSYNVGQGHVLDAWNLAKKYGSDENKWTTAVEYLDKKSDPNYFKDPVVKYGYCRCEEPVEYVVNIYGLYEHYKTLLNNNVASVSSD